MCATIASDMLTCRSSVPTIGVSGTDDRADAPQQLALGVVIAVGHHGAVQLEKITSAPLRR